MPRPSIVVTSRAVGLDRQDRARLHRLAVEVHGAGAAVGRVAPDVGAGEAQLVAQRVDEQEPWLHVQLVRARR